MTNKTDYIVLIREYVEHLKESMEEADKEYSKFPKEEDTPDKAFVSGQSLAYYSSLSSLRMLAKGFLIPLKEIDLGDPI